MGASNLRADDRHDLPPSRAASRTSMRRGEMRSASVDLPDIREA